MKNKRERDEQGEDERKEGWNVQYSVPGRGIA